MSSEYINSLPTCPETGLKVERYVSSSFEDWQPTLPEGWTEYDLKWEDRDEDLKWHESVIARRIGPARQVWAVAASQVEGVTFIPAS